MVVAGSFHLLEAWPEAGVIYDGRHSLALLDTCPDPSFLAGDCSRSAFLVLDTLTVIRESDDGRRWITTATMLPSHSGMPSVQYFPTPFNQKTCQSPITYQLTTCTCGFSPCWINVLLGDGPTCQSPSPVPVFFESINLLPLQSIKSSESFSTNPPPIPSSIRKPHHPTIHDALHPR